MARDRRQGREPEIRIVSGGQTGADRAALDWALARGIDCGGWCPAGRAAEDGAIDGRYPVRETPSPDSLVRTEWNVRDSDGTVILSLGRELSGGSLATLGVARRLGKPVLHLGRQDGRRGERLRTFVERHRITVLNVAGPRQSEEPAIGAFVERVLTQAFGDPGAE